MRRLFAAIACVGLLGCGAEPEPTRMADAPPDAARAELEEPAPEPPPEPGPAPPPIELTPLETFGSAEAIGEWLGGLEARAERMRERRRRARGRSSGAIGSVVNRQEAGVGEGSIVERAGDYLVVLRRGRLYTARIADDALEPVARIDVPDPARRRSWSWYDEMLVSGSTVVVIGYSYSRRGTEVLLFDLGDDGALTRGPGYVMRGTDYYSSRNYASRVMGDELILYMPTPLARRRRRRRGEALAFTLPSLRALDEDEGESVIDPAEILRPIQHVAAPMLHTVVRCSLSARPLTCEGRAIVGARSRSFYVSPSAVYVWVPEPRWWRNQHEDAEHDAVLYRWPHDGSAPGALRVSGSPIDQLSFAEREGFLDVAVRSGAGTDGMWGPERSRGDLSMLRVPLAALSGGAGTAEQGWYTALESPANGAIQNRHVGDVYLYGQGAGWFGPNRAREGFVRAHRIGTSHTTRVELGHSVDRIEAIGRDALVIGTGGGDLGFSVVGLEHTPSVASHFVHPDAAQGETRTHGFYFLPDADGGTLGLPVRGGRRGAWRQLIASSAGVVFMRLDGQTVAPLGALAASRERVRDRCRVSCIDWYGNSRPIFTEDRVFALLGYELVEGRIQDGGIRERRRVHLFSDTE